MLAGQATHSVAPSECTIGLEVRGQLDTHVCPLIKSCPVDWHCGFLRQTFAGDWPMITYVI